MIAGSLGEQANSRKWKLPRSASDTSHWIIRELVERLFEPYNSRVSVNRRSFIATCGLAALEAWLGLATRLAASAADQLAPVANARHVGNVPLGRFSGGTPPPLGSLLGAGLDARQFTDLATLDEGSLLTPVERFFIRTAATPAILANPIRSIHLGGRVARPIELPVSELDPLVRAQGVHLMECAGNSDPANFGLMSATTWEGIPVPELLDRVTPQGRSWRVLVTGADDPGPSRSSRSGASWIFAADDLQRAFLAKTMDGAPLTPHHGAPLRLLVPGWYGCACIKWVTHIDIVEDAAAATTQMMEFAGRTHQVGRPERARDFEVPVIDFAAAPVRVERWREDDRDVYRVVGIRWGGPAFAKASVRQAATEPLMIRFKHNQPFVRVDEVLPRPSASTWGLWSHVWRPEEPGTYQVTLRVDDPTIRARRLDMFFYTREVRIED